MRRVTLCGLLLSATVTASASGSSGAGTGVWIIHASDPHLYVDKTPEPPATETPVQKQTRDQTTNTIRKQRALNEQALRDLMARGATLAGPEAKPRILVLTGDFDSDPCWIAGVPELATVEAKDSEDRTKILDCTDDAKLPAAKASAKKAERDSQVKTLASILATSTLPDIYIVPGNNDIAREAATNEAVAYFNTFIGDVQTSIVNDAKSAVRLHNLTGCYVGGSDAECFADVPDTSYRLISFPSYSFKNAYKPALRGNDALQLIQVKKFADLVEQARAVGKRALVITHVPEFDDPFDVGRFRYADTPKSRADAREPKAAADPAVDVSRSALSAWSVSKPVLDVWVKTVSSTAVAAVLAGHFHDSHKEIYRQPYTWVKSNAYADYRDKLFLTPPLAVKAQDSSPIQARGVSLIRLFPDRVERQLFWYDQDDNAFIADSPAGSRPPHAAGRRGLVRRAMSGVRRGARWIWGFPAGQPIERLTVLLIAFLFAFLTVVRVWQIPPPADPFVGQDAGTPAASGAALTPAAAASFEPSPFAGNFGKTVIAGLAGLAAETVVKAMSGGTTSAMNDKEFYIIWFILFFFSLLTISTVVRAGVELLRTRLVLIHFAPVLPPFDPDRLAYVWHVILHWLRRFWEWVISLRVALLTFADTFINLIQGQNQTRTKVFSDLIVEQQRNDLRVAEVISRQLTSLIEQKLLRAAQEESTQTSKEKPQPPGGTPSQPAASPPPQPPGGTPSQPPTQPPTQTQPDQRLEFKPGDVRVNISVMSANKSEVFYIARTEGSAAKSFGKRSVAWISVFTGRIRWYRESYRTRNADSTEVKKPDDSGPAPEGTMFSQIVLFDNQDRTIADDETTIFLKSHFQPRGQDYQAFVVFPVPWPRRAYSGDYVRGAIHLSFRHEAQFDFFWNRGDRKRPLELQRAGDQQQFVYVSEDELLGEFCQDAELRAVLNHAIAVLGKLLHGFNENVYKYSGPV